MTAVRFGAYSNFNHCELPATAPWAVAVGGQYSPVRQASTVGPVGSAANQTH